MLPQVDFIQSWFHLAYRSFWGTCGLVSERWSWIRKIRDGLVVDLIIGHKCLSQDVGFPLPPLSERICFLTFIYTDMPLLRHPGNGHDERYGWHVGTWPIRRAGGVCIAIGSSSTGFHRALHRLTLICTSLITALSGQYVYVTSSDPWWLRRRVLKRCANTDLSLFLREAHCVCTNRHQRKFPTDKFFFHLVEMSHNSLYVLDWINEKVFVIFDKNLDENIRRK